MSDPVAASPGNAGSSESFVFPASSAQQRIWFVCQLDRDANRAYEMSLAYTVEGTIDPGLLESALAVLVVRHEILRTRFVLFDDSAARFAGELCQVIEPSGEIPLHRVTGTDLGADAGFVPDRLPLVAVRLVEVPGERPVLQLLAHHLVFDGWSASVFTAELSAVYAALAAGREPDLPDPVQYADFSEWQRERLSGPDDGLEHWASVLSGVPPLQLGPNDRRGSRQSFRGGRIPVRVPATLARRVDELAVAERATPFMVLLAAWQAVLARRTGQARFAVGTPVAGRDRPELESALGLFVNTVVLPADLDGDPTFRELVRRSRDTALDGFAHQEVPFERIVRRVAPDHDLSRSPLFQTFFSVAAVGPHEVTLGDARLRPRETPRGTAMFDLRVALHPEDGALAGWLEYKDDLFDARAARELLRQWLDLVEELLDAPDAAVAFDRADLVDAAGPPAAPASPAGPGPARSEPATPLESELLAIFRELLGRPDTDVSTSFFDVGGTSLLAVRAMRRIRRTLRVSVPVETIFSLTTVVALAAAIESPDSVDEIPDSEGIEDDMEAIWVAETRTGARP